MRAQPLPFLPAFLPHRGRDGDPALCDDAGTSLTYGALRAMLEKSAGCFVAESRGLIFCCVPRTVEGALAYLAAAQSGHAVGMIDVLQSQAEIFIETYRPDWIIRMPGRVPENYAETEWPLTDLSLLRRKNTVAEPPHPDLYLLLLTSGSTGSCKGVRLSYASLAANTEAIVASLGLSRGVRALAHLPLYYSFGLSVLHAQLASGGVSILTEHGVMTREFWHLARTLKASLFPGVPYHYKMLARLGLNRLQAPDLKIFLQAGGKMEEALTHELWHHLKPQAGQLFVMYGQTEASPRISCLPVHERPDKIGSCGRALPGGSLAIEDGEVIYGGPNVMMGYAEKRDDLACGDDMHGLLATGDVGQIDGEGYLTILGRRQRFAKLLGRRIALDDLERIASTLATVVAVEREEQIVLATTEADEKLHMRVRDLVAAETGLPSTWFAMRNVGVIPHNANGKVDYRKLCEML